MSRIHKFVPYFEQGDIIQHEDGTQYLIMEVIKDDCGIPDWYNVLNMYTGDPETVGYFSVPTAYRKVN